MNQAVRVCFAVACIAAILAQPVLAQQNQRISESERTAPSMRYAPLQKSIEQQSVPSSNYVPSPLAKSATVSRAGIMINAYTSSTVRTNQLGYDYVNDVVTVIFRGGPVESYPDQGNGSLVLNTTTDGGTTWSGNSAIFNEEFPSDVEDSRLCARLPNIYSMNDNGTSRIATIWNQFHTTFLTPAGILGTMIHKAGPVAGPYQGAKFDNTNVYQYYANRIVSDNNGALYTFFQTINTDQDQLTGEYFLTKSTDNGITWTVSTLPILTESSLEDSYQIFGDAMTFDVSPDGTTMYLGFVGIFVEDGSFTFTENRLGYVRSTDGGATWSAPVMYPLYDWTFENTPSGAGVNTLEGWMLPSISVAVDGLNKPHFLMSVNGQDTFYPLDSMLVGEITINPADQTVPPTFWAFTSNILPDFRRKINPRGATTGAQPDFSIWAEHEWSKSPDGMKLIAKWIDADSLFVTTPAGHAQPYVRDSTHDIFILQNDVASAGNANHGWATTTITVDGQPYEVLDILNVTQSVGTDEKFTKMVPKFNPATGKLYFLYTIMATGEFVPGQIYPDTDDIGPGELFFVPYSIVAGIDERPEGLPEGFSLSQNFPNPFNPTTSIAFSVHQAGNVKIKVLNLLGQEIGVAFDAFVEAGSHTASFDAKNLPSGQYMYRLESSGYSVSKIMTLMK